MLIRLRLSTSIRASCGTDVRRIEFASLHDDCAYLTCPAYKDCIVLVIHWTRTAEDRRRRLDRLIRTFNEKSQDPFDPEVLRSCWDELSTLCRGGDSTFVLVDTFNARVIAEVSEMNPVRLYLKPQSNTLVISDSLTNLVKGKRPPNLDQKAVWFCINRGFAPSPNTIYSGVYKLPVRMRFDYRLSYNNDSTMRTRIEGDFVRFLESRFVEYTESTIELRDTPQEDAKSAFWDYLTGRIGELVLPDKRASILLSGGADSLVVFEALLRSGISREMVSALHFDVSGDRSGADVRATEGICEKYGVPVRVMHATNDELGSNAHEMVAGMTEPTGDLGYFPAQMLLDAYSEDMDVALVGDGVDVFVRYSRSMGRLRTLKDSTAYRARDMLDRIHPVGRFLRFITHGKYHRGLGAFTSILLNPGQRFLDSLFGGFAPPVEDDLVEPTSDLSPLARWLLDKDLEQMIAALTVYCLLIEYPDFFTRKLFDLTRDKDVRVFSLMNDERGFMRISPMFTSSAQADTGPYSGSKSLQRGIIREFGDSEYTVTRKGSLAINTERRLQFAAALASGAEISAFLQDAEIHPGAREGFRSRTKSLTEKQLVTTSIIANWVRANG